MLSFVDIAMRCLFSVAQTMSAPDQTIIRSCVPDEATKLSCSALEAASKFEESTAYCCQKDLCNGDVELSAADETTTKSTEKGEMELFFNHPTLKTFQKTLCETF